MNQYLGLISIVVRDYNEAIRFYTEKLNFILTEDTVLTDTKRWVVVAPANAKGASLLLAKAANEDQAARIGNQTGGRVFLFLYTNDFDTYYQHLLNGQVQIVRQPTEESWGKVAVFADLYGNLWDLIERRNLD